MSRPDTNSKTRFLRLPKVRERTGLSRATIYAKIANGTFPRPVKLGPRASGWVDGEIDSWINDQIAAREAA